MGSQSGTAPLDAEGLAWMDRHEVAHCVLNNHAPAGAEPPAVLTEGWAQANQGEDPVLSATRAWEEHRQGDDFTLNELTGPDWYDRHEWPVYYLGAPLVNLLLERFGPERFLALYTTCGQSTFDADCRRVLGMGLDDLDAAFQSDLQRRVGSEGPHGFRLRRLAVDPAVGTAAWQAFLDKYLPEAERLLKPYEYVRLTSEYRYSTADPQGKTTEFVEHSDLAKSGRLRSLRTRSENREYGALAVPRHSLEARRKDPSDPWEVREFPTMSSERSYRRALSAIDRHSDFTKMAAILLLLVEELRNRVETSAITVAKLEQFTEGGHPSVRIRVEDRTPNQGVSWRSFTIVLSADDHFVVKSQAIEFSDNRSHHGEFAYDRYADRPVIRSIRNAGTEADGTQTASTFTVLDRRFGPTAESEFTAERLLAGSPVRTVTQPDPYAGESAIAAGWYQLPLAAGMVCLVAGLATGLRPLIRPGHRPEPVGHPSPIDD
jgi:hypothetical protein